MGDRPAMHNAAASENMVFATQQASIRIWGYEVGSEW